MGFLNRIFKKEPSVDKNLLALKRFEDEIKTWDREQARIAVACFSWVVMGNRDPVAQLYGPEADFEEALYDLQVGHMRFLQTVIDEFAGNART